MYFTKAGFGRFLERTILKKKFPPKFCKSLFPPCGRNRDMTKCGGCENFQCALKARQYDLIDNEEGLELP